VGHVSPLVGGDAFLLCSDGLWAYIGEEEAGSILASQSPRDAASALIELARQRARGRGQYFAGHRQAGGSAQPPRTDYAGMGG
jgi:hypothetical protein